jgi:hypothetical protein
VFYNLLSVSALIDVKGAPIHVNVAETRYRQIDDPEGVEKSKRNCRFLEGKRQALSLAVSKRGLLCLARDVEDKIRCLLRFTGGFDDPAFGIFGLQGGNPALQVSGGVLDFLFDDPGMSIEE